ncbi:hypothetical protein JB92DRAFT_1707527 [Gautieria morchelliformis]|nr:hypothetical protein JB92DRAFT_1707527 [Gautieria morchelliformis]
MWLARYSQLRYACLHAEIMELVVSDGSWDSGSSGSTQSVRGKGWRRPSFTYNTKPSAAYTYAPTYTRFGSGIKAIHLIGPNKPWMHLHFRAPGSATQYMTHTARTPKHPSSYGYSSLRPRIRQTPSTAPILYHQRASAYLYFQTERPHMRTLGMGVSRRYQEPPVVRSH